MGAKQREKTLIAQLKDITTEPKAKYVMYKCGLESDWGKLSKAYLNNKSLEWCDENYKTDESVQQAMKHVLKVLHGQRLIELYDIYFERAKDDTNAFKAFIDFSDKFFADKAESELLSILNGVDVDE